MSILLPTYWITVGKHVCTFAVVILSTCDFSHENNTLQHKFILLPN